MNDDDLKQLIADIDREKVERARRMPLEEKFRAGFQLYRWVMDRMRWGIRAQFPEADEQEVERILQYRLKLTRGHDVPA